MHLTLKQETMSPMAANRRAQQRRFDQFRQEYNQLRPHEALDMPTPASDFTASRRVFPARVPEPDNPAHTYVRKVLVRGEIAWRGRRHVFLNETLIGEHVGLEPIDEPWYTIYFIHVPLARFDSRTRTVHRLPSSSLSRIPKTRIRICQLCPRPDTWVAPLELGPVRTTPAV
jgi:putative transposase